MLADGQGLSLEVAPNGRKAWVSRYLAQGRAGKITLGRFPELSLATARNRHAALLCAIANGDSPREFRRIAQPNKPGGPTVREFCERYLSERVEKKRKSTAPVRRWFEREIWPVIGDLPIASVSKARLRALIWKKRDGNAESRIPGRPQSAMAIYKLLRQVWNYAVVNEVVALNPLVAIESKYVAEPSERKRTLKPAEIKAFLHALEHGRMSAMLRDCIMLIFLTLTRKGEVLRAEWSEFDLDRAEWSLPEEHSKGGNPLLIPLSKQAVEILRRQRDRWPDATVVFPGKNAQSTPLDRSTLNKALKRERLKINHFTIHDLRRTASTMLAEHGNQSDWIERALNHKRPGVKGIYNRAELANERAKMLQAWADWLDSLKRQN